MLHDACGVGFVADLRRRSTHAIVECGLTALRRLAHRGASPDLGAVDGCGVLTAIPWTLLADQFPGGLPGGRTRAAGMAFAGLSDVSRAIAVVERELRSVGATAVVWRSVPVDAAAVLPAQRASTPRVLQFVAAFDLSAKATEVSLYRARLRVERIARDVHLDLTIVSLSTATIVHKALVTPDALDRFYPELSDARYASRFIVFHQRFSTNTSADWALAQPFRMLAHNGEINTIAGNRGWMRARLADASSLGALVQADGLEPLSPGGSDSRSLDEALELMCRNGYSVAHALSRLVPPAWEREHHLAPEVRAYHEFQSLLSEPWDGPSALIFGDGRYVGAALDRNGFRPARTVTTEAGLFAVASEAGVLREDEHRIVDRGRLGPGDMVLVDLERGTVLRTGDIHRRLARLRPYQSMVEQTLIALEPGVDCDRESGSNAALLQRQAACGCTREEIELIVKPMIADAHEAVGSMGDDAPPAVLSSRSRLFTDYFRQRFAQVTNPPVDPYRESSVMSLTTLLGGHGDFIHELGSRPPRIALDSPVLTAPQLASLVAQRNLPVTIIDALFDVARGSRAFEERLQDIATTACDAVAQGSALIVLSDRNISDARAALPAALVTAAVHHALIADGLRMRCSIVVETGDVRDAHQLAVLCAYGASAVCPSLAYDTVEALAGADCDAVEAGARYRTALERGLLTAMSKMGVCTFSGYLGAQLFEILGLDASVVERFFTGSASPIGGATLDDVAAITIERHRRAFTAAEPTLGYPGLHTYRRDGEYHANNPVVIRGLQRARDEGTSQYATFKSHVYGRPPSAVRDLLEFAPATPIALERVEPAEAICRRFFASAMSVGALSPEAHRMIARAMNRIGSRSNSGEGGEEPDRYVRPADGDWDGSRTKQVASARFGVTPAYLRSADELQIKIAQGSKPGEGGQLPAVKVVPHIARLRHAQPGTPLISPPVHHDIYSIEDLAQLIFDLRAFHPDARINVKLVASTGVGIIAAGVAKAGADAIQISGHDGGTGASPRGSIKHAGMPWEIGLAEAHRALEAAGLRHRVVLQTDGGLKTGRDIAMAAALGAQEFGFGTAALVALGCVMARQCHANTCPVGIATQREDLRADFAGTPEMLVGYLMLIANEVREILASLGLTRLDELVGRVDLLRRRSGVQSRLSIDSLLVPAAHRTPLGDKLQKSQTASAPRVPAIPHGISELLDTIAPDTPLMISGTIVNTDRTFGAGIAGKIAERFGDAGLPDGSVQIAMTGTAGQSFGAFALPGMQLTLVGDANDGVAKGMHGGEIAIAPPARERGRSRQVLVGNAALYGATGGCVFIAGAAGERFAVRNSGATAVVEGVGDHACEYMTGGAVVILGPVGRNFAAGMTGGIVYVLDPDRALIARAEEESSGARQITIDALNATDRVTLTDLLQAHASATGSREARTLLRRDPTLAAFVRVSPAGAQRATDAEEAAVAVNG